MHVIPIASGKGGVGKSLFAANLAIALGQAGKRVVLVDLDLGGSNLHLILGMRNLRSGIGTFLTDTRSNLENIILQSDYENVRFIPGDAEIPGMANLTTVQKRRLLNKLLDLDADYLVLDLGAGTSSNTLDSFLTARRGVIVTTPAPTSLVNAYLFLKNVTFKILSSAVEKDSPAEKYLKQLYKDSTSIQKIYIGDIVQKIAELHPPSHAKIQEAFRRFSPRLVLNMLEDPKDADKAWKLRRSCQQYLGFDIEHLGVMYRDDIQDTALHAGLPIIRYKPKAVLSQAIARIADKILQSETEEEDDIGIPVYNQSFETAELEAEVDFQSRVEYIEELLQSGALTAGDLVETIKNQQLELVHLRKENSFLKSKIVQAAQQGLRL